MLSRIFRRCLVGLLVLTASAFPAIAISGPAAAGACSPVMRSLAVAKASVSGGTSTVATVSISCATPKKAKVTILAGAGAGAPRTVVVPKGKKKQTFTVTTSPTAASRSVRLSATFKGRTARASLSVRPTPCYPTAVLRSLTFAGPGHAGDTSAGTVTLDCPAAKPIAIALTSADPRVQVPGSVTVKAGARTATFAVSAATPTGEEHSYRTTVRATQGGRSTTGSLTVEPGLSEVSLTIAEGSNFADVAVTLTGTSDATTVVSVALNGVFAGQTSSIEIPPGSTSASTRVWASGGTVTDGDYTATATLGNRRLTASRSVSHAFREGDTIDLEAVAQRDPASEKVTVGITITLDHPVGTGTPDRLKFWTNGTFVSEKSLAWGQRSVQLAFTLTRFPADSFLHTSVIFDGLTRYPTFGYEIDVPLHPWVASVTPPDVVVAGEPTTGTVALVAAAAVDETVTLNADGVGVPSTVIVPAGSSSVEFPITAATAGTGSVGASAGGVSVESSTFTVGPAIPNNCRTLTLNTPTEIYRGVDLDGPTSYTASVSVSCTAPTDLLIPLTATYDGDWLTVPRHVRIPAGSSTGEFILEATGTEYCESYDEEDPCPAVTGASVTAGPAPYAVTRSIAVRPGLAEAYRGSDSDEGMPRIEVWLTREAAPGTVVDLSSDRPDLLDFPTEVEVPAGMQGFLLSPSSGTPVPAGTTVRVTITLGASSETVTIIGG